MKVTSKAVIHGFADYLTEKVNPQYPADTMGSFMMGFSSGIIRRRAETVGKKLLSNPLISTFVIEEDGMIELEDLIGAAQDAISDNGLRVAIPLSGEIVFRKNDAAVIRQYIENAPG